MYQFKLVIMYHRLLTIVALFCFVNQAYTYNYLPCLAKLYTMVAPFDYGLYDRIQREYTSGYWVICNDPERTYQWIMGNMK